MRNGDFIAVGTVDFTDEEMSLIKNIFDSICFYPYKSDNKYKGEKVTTTLSYMLPYVPFFLFITITNVFVVVCIFFFQRI